MEDTLEVYHRQQDPKRPVVCLDEGSKQLTKETRLPLPPRPGAVAKYDYEYERNGTSNLFLLFAPLQAWRHVKVTARRGASQNGGELSYALGKDQAMSSPQIRPQAICAAAFS